MITTRHHHRSPNGAVSVRGLLGSPIEMPVLAMRAVLPDVLKAEAYQRRGHFAGLQDREGAHRLRDLDGPKANEFRLELRFAVLKQHRDDFTEVLLEFIERGSLTVGPRPARNRTDEQTRLGIAFDDHVERAQVLASSTSEQSSV
jgi:hypothetical protein